MPGQTPTRVRHGVIVFAVVVAVVAYIDRVCIAQAAPLITRDLHLSRLQLGAVFSAFTLAYALFEIPTGFLGDWMGPRRVLAGLVVWWSFFTAATAWAWGLLSLWVTRFLFGIGEAGFFPNMTKAFTTWLPRPERARAQGIMWMSARWGGAFTPWLVFQVLQHVSWRGSFELFGAVGGLSAVWFFLWYRDNPREKKGMNAAEVELIESGATPSAGHSNVPWAKLARSKDVWLLCGQYFCVSYAWYFYISWLPIYLQEARGLEVGRSAVLGGLPLFLGGIGAFVGGFLASWLARRVRSVALIRRRIAYVGYGGAAALLVVSPNLPNPVWTMIIMGLASFFGDLVLSGSWGSCMDVGGRCAGTLSGAMNMMGNLGGTLSPVVIGYILHETNNWPLTFYLSAGMYVTGAILWRFVDPVTAIE